MARRPPFIITDMLLALPDAADGTSITVGSPAWFAWLAHASSFAFICQSGRFTATKESRSPTRAYWKASRHRHGRLYRAYLGTTADLTPERLLATAILLAGEDAAQPGAPADRQPSPAAVAAELPAPGVAAPPTIEAERHLLESKFRIPPPHPDSVIRPRLMADLDAALLHHQRLIVITAPAGFGKTTLASTWLARRPGQAGRVAWLSLDDDDNDLGQFLAYLITALERTVPALGTAAWDLFRAAAANPPIHALVQQLCAALTAHDSPLIVVLDDYHCLLHPTIHDTLRLFLAHLPQQITLILTSRADPPVGLARLRLRGVLTELRTADVRFTYEEIEAFFARLPALALAPADVAQLESRTEGWAAGLHLAALSLQHQDAARRTTFLTEFSGTHAYVFDYLLEEVFRRQPAPIQRFLLQTAILSRFCGPLCAAVLDHPDAPAWLAAVEAANLFVIALDTRREWFRYHPLFREVLLAWFARTEGNASQALLHQRASAWYAQAGFPREAIAHALNAQAWPAAFQAMEPLMEGAAMYEYFVEWPRWVAAIPRSEFQTHPTFSVRLAWVLMFTGYIEVAEQLLDDAEAGAHKDPHALPAGIVQVWRAMAWYWRRAVQQTVEVATQALAMLPAQATTLRAITTHLVGMGNLELGHADAAREPLQHAHMTLQSAAESEPFFTLSAALGLGRVFTAQGQLQRAAALYRHVIERCPPFLQGPSPYIEYGLLAYEWNDVATAEDLLREGLAVGQRSGRGRYWPNGLALLARVCWAKGDGDQAQQYMDQAQAAADLLGTPRAQEDMAAQQAWLRFALGDVAAAINWLHTWAMPGMTVPLYVHYPSTVMAIRLQIATAGTLLPAAARDAALERLAHLLSAAQQDQRILDQIALLVLTALGHADHDDAAAHGALTAALDLAEPAGCIRRIIDEGPRVHAMLRALRAQSAGLAAQSPRVRFLDQLLAARRSVTSPAAQSHPVNPLSDREQEILQLLAAGQTIPQIARQLIVSVHTARTHVKNIYAKLGAHNRVQALEQVRVRQLL